LVIPSKIARPVVFAQEGAGAACASRSWTAWSCYSKIGYKIATDELTELSVDPILVAGGLPPGRFLKSGRASGEAGMRKIILMMSMSLDGFFEGPHGELD
jgi:hypothetical protein